MANATSDYTNFFPAQRKTRLPGGYMGKVLRVDMTTGKLTDLNLPEEPMLRKYWGGQLFAEYVLLNEVPLQIDPYDPKNVIVGMTARPSDLIIRANRFAIPQFIAIRTSLDRFWDCL